MPSEQLLTEMGQYNEALAKAGVLLAADGLHPSSKGARVRFSGKKRTVIDGPFTATKDLIAGFWLFQVKSKEEVIDWVKRAPFDGQCEAAFKFYQQCLGGEIVAMIPFGETPACDHVSAESRDKIMHARLMVGNQVLMGSDTTSEHPYEGIKGSSVALNVDATEEAERTFEALAENGTVQMPLEETFWANRFRMLVDHRCAVDGELPASGMSLRWRAPASDA